MTLDISARMESPEEAALPRGDTVVGKRRAAAPENAAFLPRDTATEERDLVVPRRSTVVEREAVLLIPRRDSAKRGEIAVVQSVSAMGADLVQDQVTVQARAGEYKLCDIMR